MRLSRSPCTVRVLIRSARYTGGKRFGVSQYKGRIPYLMSLIGRGCVKTIWQALFLGRHPTNEPSICLYWYKNPISSSEIRKYREQFPLKILSIGFSHTLGRILLHVITGVEGPLLAGWSCPVFLDHPVKPPLPVA